MRIDVATEELRLAAPLPTAHGTIDRRLLVLLTVADGEHEGHGEAAPLPGFGLETPAEAEAALRAWASGGPEPSTPAASAASSCALHELDRARRGDVLPAGRLLVQALVGASDPQDVATACANAARRGHTAVKLKVGAGSPDLDVERVAAASAALPSDVPLRLDANQAWEHATALRILTALDDIALDLVEEPTNDPADWPSIEEATGLVIAADESLSDPDRAAALLTHGGLGAAVLKPAVLGGPVHTIELARQATEAGARTIISSFIDGPVGLRCARDVALTVAPHEVHGIGTADLFETDLPLDVTPIAGALHTDLRQMTLPPGLQFARSTPGFDAGSVPAGLLATHEVAGGNWAELRVHEGELRFEWEGVDARTDARVLRAGETQVIPPARPHRVEPTAAVRFQVDFFREVA